MPLNRLTPLPVIWAMLLASCSIRHIPPTTLGNSGTVADSALMLDWQALMEARQVAGGCQKDNGQTCDLLRAKIERLSVDCPNNANIAMANAVLAFDDRNFARAQQLLDEFFRPGNLNPEGAVLRARIAMEQGNMPFALKFLEQQIHQTGDHSGLRETYASALYLTNHWEEAQEQLTIARRLGAPEWRISYGFGLIEEAQGHYQQAKSRYEESLKAKPGFRTAQSRLRALIASGKIPAGS